MNKNLLAAMEGKNHDRKPPYSRKGHHVYDPVFVESVLQADAGPVEATFNNVTDMLSWLEK